MRIETDGFAPLARRAFLGRASAGLGCLALTRLLRPAALWSAERASGSTTSDRPFISRGVVSEFHVPPKVRRVIFLYMSGGPSQFESFDYKPELERLDGQPMPDSFTQGQPIAQLQGQRLVCLRPLVKFRRYGASGQELSELFPHIGSLADDICIIRSMHTDQINHDPAHTVMNTGTPISGRPSMGSWVLYGLGSEAEDLPGFVVLASEGGRNPQPISNRMWHSGFLPGKHQGIKFQSQGEAVYYLNRPRGVSPAQQADVFRAVQELNVAQRGPVPDPELETRLSQYELASRMQLSVPALVDFSDETAATLQSYGTQGADGSFAANCLLARRLAERGVRFIQLYHRGWDHHNNLSDFMKQCTGLCDGPTAALVRDLKQRGLFHDTLLIWGGEFGRTPMAQSNKGAVGRDHHMRSFSMWLAGGGIKPGITYGGTDELGYHAADNPVHVHDLQATILHLLGIDHERLTFRYQGRYFRLTDVAGRVVQPILA